MDPDGAATPASKSAKARRLAPAIGMSAILVALAVSFGPRRDRGPRPVTSAPIADASARAAAPPPPAGPIELSILAPLVVGSTSKGWKVRSISAVHEGAIVVSFAEEKGDGVVDLFVVASAEDEVAPPASAGRYAVFYAARRALPEDGERLAKVLAKAIEKNQDAPAPPGLRPFVPQPKQHQPI
jgi:hypothetical protein